MLFQLEYDEVMEYNWTSWYIVIHGRKKKKEVVCLYKNFESVAQKSQVSESGLFTIP